MLIPDRLCHVICETSRGILTEVDSIHDGRMEAIGVAGDMVNVNARNSFELRPADELPWDAVDKC